MSAFKRELIRDLDGFTGSAKLWRISPAVEYGYSDDRGKTEYVVSSATIALFSGPETYIFPANEAGEIIDWGELPGSFRGSLNHDAAMDGLADEWDWDDED